MQKICEMQGVHEYSEDFPVELWRNDSNRLVVHAKNEGGCNFVEIYLMELIAWLKEGPTAVGDSNGNDISRDRTS